MRIFKKILSYYMLFLKKLREDDVSAYAAQASFFIIISFFPFCMFLMTLLKLSPITEEDFFHAIYQTVPAALVPYVTGIISEIYNSPTTTVISITILATIWSASKAFHSLIFGLNSVYNIPENRNFFLLRFFASIYTVLFAFMLLVTMLLLVFGNSLSSAIDQHFPALQQATLFVISLRQSVTLFILVLYFLCLYMVIPNRKSKLVFELPGALFSSVGWIGFSSLYSYYIDHMSSFSNTYGSLTAIALMMLWVYFCMYILLIGGELNDCIRRFFVAKHFFKTNPKRHTPN